MKKFQFIYYIFLVFFNSFIKSVLIETETRQFKKWRQQKQNYTSELHAQKSFTQKITINEMKSQAIEWERLSSDTVSDKEYIYIYIYIFYIFIYI